MSFQYLQHESNKPMELPAVKRILGNIDQTRISSCTPDAFAAGDVYLYEVTDEFCSREWLSDGKVWLALRTKHLPKGGPFEWTITTYQMKSAGIKVGFYRKVFTSFGAKSGDYSSYQVKYVIVNYYGSFDPQKAKLNRKPHGNTKKTPQKVQKRHVLELQGVSPSQPTPVKRSSPDKKRPRRKLSFEQPLNSGDEGKSNSTTINLDDDQSDQSEIGFTPTDPQVMRNLEQKIENTGRPTQSYRDTLAESVASGGLEKVGGTPRNTKQALNIQYKLSTKRDDLYFCYHFQKEYPLVMPDMVLGPGVAMTLCNPNIVDHVRLLLNLKHIKLLCHYDTTFCIGQFYVSGFVFRHPLFKSQPIIPLILLVHEVGNEHDSHKFLFSRLKELIRKIDCKNVVVVTDREAAITNSIRNNLPNVRLHYCWNHLRRNLSDFVDKKLGSTEAIKRKEQYNKLLQSNTMEEYSKLYNEFSGSWEPEFIKYYVTYHKTDVLENAIFKIKDLGIADTTSGLTNNASESFNSSLKKAVPNPNCDFEKLVLSTYFLLSFYSIEIFRGLKGLGNYSLKENVEQTNELLEQFDIKAEESVGHTLEDIKSFIDSGILRTDPANKEEEFERPRTQEALARFFIKNDRVEWLHKKRCFIVSGLRNKNFLVDLGNMSCTCRSQVSCAHLIAVLKGANLYEPHKKKGRKVGNLGKLYRSRVRPKTGGKGNPSIRIPRCLAVDPSAGLHSEENTDIEDTTVTSPVKIQGPEVEVNVPTPKKKFTFKKRTPSALGSSKPNLRITKKTWETADVISLLPSLTKANALLKVLNGCEASGEIFFADLCSLKTKFKRTESQALSVHSAKLGYEIDGKTLSPGYLTEKVLLEFLFMIKKQDHFILLPWETLHFMKTEGFDDEPESTKTAQFQNYNKVFLLVNAENVHWLLICVDSQDHSVNVMDPNQYFQLNLEDTRFKSLLSRIDRDANWNVTYPLVPVQDDGINCGIYLCYYFECLVNGWAFDAAFDPEKYRNYILAKISSTCKIYDFSHKSICQICKRMQPPGDSPKFDWIACERCEKWFHKKCVKMNFPTHDLITKFICP